MDLPTFKQLLEIDVIDTSKDVILQQVLDSTVSFIEDYINYPLSLISKTDELKGTNSRHLLVRTYPIITLTSVTESLVGISLDITSQVTIRDYTIGELYREAGFIEPYSYSVTYTAGYSVIPASLEYASRTIALKLYSQLDRIKDGVISLKTPDGTVSYDNTLVSKSIASILDTHKHLEVG